MKRSVIRTMLDFSSIPRIARNASYNLSVKPGARDPTRLDISLTRLTHVPVYCGVPKAHTPLGDSLVTVTLVIGRNVI